MKANPANVALGVSSSVAGPDTSDQAPKDLTPQAHSVLLNRAYEEYLRRCQAGEPLDADVFCERFPGVHSSLGRLIYVHRLLQEHGDVDIEWPQAGGSFLGFDLQEKLGEGAFAHVFRAVEPALGGRQVAVKISQHGAAEADTLGRLDHPNIVPVHSVQEDPETGLTAVCMPYAGRATLHHVLDYAFRKDQPPPRRAAIILEAARDPALPQPAAPRAILRRGSFGDGIRFIAAQMADALAFMHARGICHRDLKPSNVLITPEGTARLLDFNLSASQQARESPLGGTLLYMSPEQLLATDPMRLGDPGSLDARADLFSLGVILYQLLTGKHPFGPFAGDVAAEDLRPLLLQRQKVGFTPLKQCCPEIDVRFARLIERCLAIAPSARPQTADEVARLLHRGLAPLARMSRWLLRHPGTVLATLVLLAAAGVAGGTALSLREANYYKLQMERGLEAYRAGKYQQALDHLNRVLAHEPDNAEAMLARGRVHLKQGDTDKEMVHVALADFQAADRLLTDGRGQAMMGYCLHRLKQPGGALLYYQKARDSGLNTAALLNNQGCVLLTTPEFADAKPLLDQAVALDPNLHPAFYNRAILAQQTVFQLKNQLRAAEVKLKGQQRSAQIHEIQLLAAEVERLRERRNHWIHQGMADFQQAIDKGAGHYLVYVDAARLFAIAWQEQKCSLEKVVDLLAQAQVNGADLAKLLDEPSFNELRTDPSVQDLLRRPPVLQPLSRPTQLLDPLPDSPQAE